MSSETKSKRPSAWLTRLTWPQRIALSAPMGVCLLVLFVGMRYDNVGLILAALALSIPAVAWWIVGVLLIVRNRKKRFWR